jgi:broad specificity phosphatase PhoE
MMMRVALGRPLRRLSIGAPVIQQVVVVRHGETGWNRQLRVQGGGHDIPLNAVGLSQAAQSADALARCYGQRGAVHVPRQIYSSPLQRAGLTALEIARALNQRAGAAQRRQHRDTQQRRRQPLPAVEVQNDARLTEWQLGAIEGMTKHDAAEAHPGDWELFKKWCDPLGVDAHQGAQCISGGGESMDEVRARVVACIEDACRAAAAGGQLPETPVVVVAHGGVIGQLLRHVWMQHLQREQWHSLWRGNDNYVRDLKVPGELTATEALRRTLLCSQQPQSVTICTD